MQFKTVSIVIPVYNEEEYILHVLQRVLKANTFGLKKEIVIVNDGSSDKTLQKIYKMYARNPKSEIRNQLSNSKFNIQDLNSNFKFQISNSKINILSLPSNNGKSAAVKYGILKSTGDIVIIQDADLEYNPTDFPKLLQPFLDQDADAVYGSRFITTSSRRILYFWHSVANTLVTTLSNMLTNFNLSDVETGYKVFSGNLIRKIASKLKSTGFGFEIEVTAKLSKLKNLKLYEVGISYTGRTYEEGKKIKMQDAFLAIYQIVRYNLL